MSEETKRAIREGARRQQGVFQLPSYISIGDPYCDDNVTTDIAPPAQPFVTGAPLTRYQNTAGSSRWKHRIESENRAMRGQPPRSSRLPPFALDDPAAYAGVRAPPALPAHAPPMAGPAPHQPQPALGSHIQPAPMYHGYAMPPAAPPTVLIPAFPPQPLYATAARAARHGRPAPPPMYALAPPHYGQPHPYGYGGRPSAPIGSVQPNPYGHSPHN